MLLLLRHSGVWACETGVSGVGWRCHSIPKALWFGAVEFSMKDVIWTMKESVKLM
jgi:hypothetical protein